MNFLYLSSYFKKAEVLTLLMVSFDKFVIKIHARMNMIFMDLNWSTPLRTPSPAHISAVLRDLRVNKHIKLTNYPYPLSYIMPN